MTRPIHAVLLALALQFAPMLGRAATGCGDHDAGSYRGMAGDKANTTQLEASRPVAGKLNGLQVNVGAGELRIERSQADTGLQLRISSPGADRKLSEYLRDFDVTNGTAHVSVCVPSNYHATVILRVPAPGGGASELNLGAGNLTLDVSALPVEDREINLGAGNGTLFLSGSHDYAELKVNVGMGHFADQRPGGSSASMAVSREMSGSGRGSLEVNVGAGSLVLKPNAQ